MHNPGGYPPNQDPYGPMGQTPGGSFGAPGYGGYLAPVQPVYASPPYEGGASARAVASLVLAIASWVACGVLTGVPAFFLARAELSSIDRGESSPAGKSLAQAAYWIGLVNLVIVAVVMVIGMMLFTFATR